MVAREASLVGYSTVRLGIEIKGRGRPRKY